MDDFDRDAMRQMMKEDGGTKWWLYNSLYIGSSVLTEEGTKERDRRAASLRQTATI